MKGKFDQPLADLLDYEHNSCAQSGRKVLSWTCDMLKKIKWQDTENG